MNRIPDKNWIVANTFPGTPHAGRLFVTFTLFNVNTNASPIMGSFSDNSGATWSVAALTQPASTNAQGSQPVFLPNGTLAMVYWNFGPTAAPDEHLEVIVSANGGVSFGAPVRIASAVESIEPQHSLRRISAVGHNGPDDAEHLCRLHHLERRRAAGHVHEINQHGRHLDDPRGNQRRPAGNRRLQRRNCRVARWSAPDGFVLRSTD